MPGAVAVEQQAGGVFPHTVAKQIFTLTYLVHFSESKLEQEALLH